MESFSRGWAFLQQAWGMALKDRDLIKPSIYSLAAGFIVSVIGVIPIIAVALLTGDSQFGRAILFVLGAAMIFLNYIVSYVFSAMTVYLIFGYLSDGDGRMDKAWAVVKRDVWDIAGLAAASTAVNLFTNAMRSNRNRNRGGDFLAGLVNTVWTEAAFLILPAMVIEDINLSDAVKRAGQITKGNLLLIGVSTVGVKTVTGLIGFLLTLAGAALGFGAGAGLIALFDSSSTLGLVLGIGLGALILFSFAMVASVINTYTGTAYHTCLYLWAHEAEKAQAAGRAIQQVAAPQPLAAVLSR